MNLQKYYKTGWQMKTTEKSLLLFYVNQHLFNFNLMFFD